MVGNGSAAGKRRQTLKLAWKKRKTCWEEKRPGL
jgi:hypothetical protein